MLIMLMAIDLCYFSWITNWKSTKWDELYKNIA